MMHWNGLGEVVVVVDVVMMVVVDVVSHPMTVVTVARLMWMVARLQ